MRSLRFARILAATESELGYMPADYVVRLCIRFWMYQSPPLVVRSRAK